MFVIVLVMILRKCLAVRAAIGTAAGGIHCRFIFGTLTVLSVMEGVRSLDVGILGKREIGFGVGA